VREKGYGLAVWPSSMKILRDELGVAGLDLRTSQSMVINRKNTDDKLEIRPPLKIKDKGFMKRSALLGCLLDKVEQLHPGCISTDHSFFRVRFEGENVTATYATDGRIVSHSCDLIVGADGVNSSVRKYVSLKLDSRVYGHMTAYRFVVPCYHISRDSDALSIVVLEYDGKPPDIPRKASLTELVDVAQRSKLSFVINILSTEKVSDLMCYSTFHIDCKPWHRSNAVIIGDAAHAYGPLTAKMANLAINDAHSLAAMLNLRRERNQSLADVLDDWEHTQRPKFEITRTRTLRHLELYAPRMRNFVTFLWQHFPATMSSYFGSIFQYDYSIYSSSNEVCTKVTVACAGVVGVDIADPLEAFLKPCFKQVVYYSFGLLIVIYLAVQCK